MGIVTEPVLTIDIGGEEFLFMVDTGAMVSLIQPGISRAQMQPCDVQARGVTCTQLDILGEQEVKFILRNSDNYMEFVHTFVVSPLKRCSSGILGMDFLQRVGAEISLTSRSLCIGHCSFPLRGQELGVSEVRRLANAGQTRSLCPGQEEKEDESVDDWEGTAELAEAVTVPPLSVRIARCRVVRRDDSAVVKVPRKEAVFVDPEGLPGIYMARVVATLEICSMSSSDASGSEPYVVNEKSPLVEYVFSPRDKFVASSDGSAKFVTSSDGVLKVGSGECLPKLPDSDCSAVTSHRDDLQARCGSLPVEKRFGNQVDTIFKNAAQREKGQVKERKIEIQNSTKQKRKDIQRKTQVLGYVPIQVVNLSLEEVDLEKQMYIGVASPIQLSGAQVEGCNVNTIQQDVSIKQENFEKYLQEKLAHLRTRDFQILGAVLRQYQHLFYGLGSKDLGCTSQIEHSIDTEEARPRKRNPYRTPHALKPVVEEHIDDMLKRKIIEPSISPWSSSIVLVQKKSKDGSVKYRFCIDYRALNAVTKPDAYPIPNIVDTLDSLGQSKIFSVLDMASGYHHIALKPEHKEKTAFSCHRGIFSLLKFHLG